METYAEQLLAYLMLAEISVIAAAAAAGFFFFCGAIFALRNNNKWPLNDFFSFYNNVLFYFQVGLARLELNTVKPCG